MPDPLFADADLAALYDLFSPWETRDDLAFYLALMSPRDAVLDVGCGTGLLLHKAREAGHTGRLCGLDPAAGMLAQARRRSDVEWVEGELSRPRWGSEFDLVVMTGHAFQVLLTDEELRCGLSTIARALTQGGRFAFETRNPGARPWERWVPDNVLEADDGAGGVVRMWNEVETPVTGNTVSFTTTFTGSHWDRPRFSRTTLRFVTPGEVTDFLAEAGLVVERQFGDFSGGPLTATSPEIITVARRAE
ncbi:class I SAM-dependent methyltransferase [Amycolatopsis rhizosphaerae]|uniref:Class I SAM-dependent methyltransferase n=1 Tax=Amycolatopsis rhizosphaerae TaxID=2053003 RepID=A0A558D341_9PSEU|nr:class I SAM-dependent methyltransferase [Amycolatopsis rhizosphaerae]TVT55428.1 class I SAM-dependent methyltransferase [Amycolatopsis rhizosphaerae]